ncbi:MAG TPA: MarR family transcriptional regulator [Candidatus Limnocylindrales bacterium]
MAEVSGRDHTFDEIEAHIQALGQLLPNRPPAWTRHDLTFGQLRLLFKLRQSGPVSIGELANLLGVTDATASELVDRVERRGLVIRVHRADDRRVVDCQLSDEGVRLLAQVAGARREGLRQALTVLTPDELAQFDRLLCLMAERLKGLTPVNLTAQPANPVPDGEGPA